MTCSWDLVNKGFRTRPPGEFTPALFNSCVAMALMKLQEKHLIGLALVMWSPFAREGQCPSITFYWLRENSFPRISGEWVPKGKQNKTTDKYKTQASLALLCVTLAEKHADWHWFFTLHWSAVTETWPQTPWTLQWGTSSSVHQVQWLRYYMKQGLPVNITKNNDKEHKTSQLVKFRGGKMQANIHNHHNN